MFSSVGQMHCVGQTMFSSAGQMHCVGQTMFSSMQDKCIV